LIELIAVTRDTAGKEYKEQPSQMGIAVAVFLDPDRTHLVYNSNLQWFERFPLRQRLSEAFPDFAIELEVDSNAATMAEYQLGSGQGSSRFLCATCGTGLGVGMAVDGVPLRFAYGCMGDIGHMVVLRDGPLCTCGGRGCAEIMISAISLARQYGTITRKQNEVTLRDVIEGAEAGDTSAISILASAGEWLGVAIASMTNTFFPDHIAIAGGLSAGGDFVLKPAERVFRETACVLARQSATFTRATLGSMATLIGAAWPFWQKESR
jgi:glucokinase